MAVALLVIAIIGVLVTYLVSSSYTITYRTQQLIQACQSIEQDIAHLYPSNDSRQVRIGNKDLLQQQMRRVTANIKGTEGGFWHISEKFFGYSYPTYVGNEIKASVPESDKTLLSSISQRALEQGELVKTVQRDKYIAAIAVACPLRTHDGLSVWLLQRVSLVHWFSTLANALLFVLIGIAGAALFVQTFRFERRWYGERDRLVKQGEDENRPVPVTSNINEVQPLLMLLYQSRQKQVQLERTISALEAKLNRNQELSTIARFSATMAKELTVRLEECRLHIKQMLSDERDETEREQLHELVKSASSIERILQSFQNLDVRHPDKAGKEQINLQKWLAKLADYHQLRSASEQQSVTAICTNPILLDTNILLLRFILDTLIMQAVCFGPKNGEVLIKADIVEDDLVIEVIDESKGISEQEQRRLFRQDDVLPDAYGKGLKPLKDAMNTIGGEIEYATNGENSRFILRIPMTND